MADWRVWVYVVFIFAHMNAKSILIGLPLIMLIFLNRAKSQTSAEELAKKLANPVSSLISLPFQNNSDYGIGARKGSRNTMNVQPVVPMGISKDLSYDVIKAI